MSACLGCLCPPIFFVSRSLVGVQPSVTSKEGDEEAELHRTTIHGYKVKRLSDDELPGEVQKCRTMIHQDASKSNDNEVELQSTEHHPSCAC